eukprot:COSAG01_NODE_16933_length_1192_cov_19.427264_2_plen_134_part_00
MSPQRCGLPQAALDAAHASLRDPSASTSAFTGALMVALVSRPPLPVGPALHLGEGGAEVAGRCSRKIRRRVGWGGGGVGRPRSISGAGGVDVCLSRAGCDAAARSWRGDGRSGLPTASQMPSELLYCRGGTGI